MTAQEALLKRTPPEMQILMVNQCHTGSQEAGTTIDAGRTKGNPHFSFHCLPQTEGLKVIGVHYQQLHRCHQFQTDQRDLSIPGVGDDVGKLGHM